MNDDVVQQLLERLEAIEVRLLGIESVSSEGLDPQVSVHILFRDFHNLKSSLSMAGADAAAKLVHEAESCLDSLRSGDGDRKSDWVDALLEVVDHVRRTAYAGEDLPEPELSERLNGMLGAWRSLPSNQVREIGFPLDLEEASALRDAVCSGRTAYVLEKIVGEGLDIADAEALPVFDALAEIGVVVAKRLTRAGGSGSVLTVIFASAEKRDELGFVLFDPFYPVHGSAAPDGVAVEACAEATGASVPGSPSAAAPSPAPRPGASSKARSEPTPARLTRILIVDDEATTLMLLQVFLSQYGRIDTAEDGSEALEKIERSIRSGDPYHVIFLDIRIPGVPGNDVLERTRNLEHQAGILLAEGSKIIMESAISDYSAISTSFQNHSDAYLVKPIEADAVDRTMQKFGFTKLTF